MAVAGVAIAGMIVGLLLGWKLWGGDPKPRPVETYAKKETQKDGSIIAERKPGALQPAAIIPKGAVVERVVQVKVKSATPTADTGTPGSGELSATAGATTLDLALVQLEDGTHRAILSSPYGTIQEAVDSPLSTEAPMKARVWALGGVFGRGEGGSTVKGLFVERDLGPVRVGADVLRRSHPIQGPSWEGLVRVGLRW